MYYQACIAFTKENPTVILDLNNILDNSDICAGLCIFNIPVITFYLNNSEEELINVVPELYKDNIDKYKEYLSYLLDHLYINGILLNQFFNKRITNSYINQEGFDDYTENVFNIQLQINPENDENSRYIWTLYIDELNPDFEFSFEFNITFTENKFAAGTTYNFLACHVDNTDYIEDYENTGVDNKSKNSAFMLLRTNPKLSGNIKLVVTDDGMYLDTFKKDTNDLLSSATYRKQPVSKSGNYGQDVFRVFNNVPSNILMDVNDSLYNTTYSLSSASDIYATQYEYGAETNEDRLYSETYKLLAPLHLGYNLPDFFIIFKSDYQPDKQQLFADSGITAQYFENLLSTCKICKVFDLREQTAIGQYLHTWNNNVIEAGINNICYTDFDLITNIQKFQNITKNYADIWHGIAYQSGGVLASKELSRFKNLTGYNQERINLYYLNGFQKCNLIYPNIINLEFMFNDPDAEAFKTYNYFGVYVSENIFHEITNVSLPGLSGIDNIVYFYDGKSSNTDNGQLINQINTCIENKKLLSITTAESVKILNKYDENPINEFKYFLNNEVSDHPGTCIANAESKQITLNDLKSFITLSFDKLITPGEHFRFIHTSLKTGKIQVLEIIASNDPRLKRFKQYPISQYVLTNHFKTEDNNDIEFYTVNIYTESVNNEPITIEEQLIRISKAIAKFNSHLTVLSYNKSSISVVSNKSNIILQHILEYNYNDSNDYVHYFNTTHNTPVYDIHNNQLTLLRNDDEYYTSEFNNPIYDTTETRLSSVVKFINLNLLRQYNIYEVAADLQSIVDSVKVPLCYGADKQYKTLSGINILDNINVLHDMDVLLNDAVSEFTVYTLLSPYNVNNALIYTTYDAMLTGNKIKIYDQTHAYLSFLSLLSVKDLNVKLDESLQAPIVINDTIKFHKSETIDFIHLDSLKKFVLYEILQGAITELDIPVGCKFMLLADSYIKFSSNKIEQLAYTTQPLSVIAGTIIKIHDYATFLKNPEECNCTMVTKNMINSNNTLIAPICPPLNISWITTGEYYDHDNTLDYKNIFNFNQERISGHFIEAGTEFPTLNTIIGIAGNEKISVKDYILRTGIIKKFYSNVPTSIGHYDLTTEILEFIYNGIQFELNVKNSSLSNMFIYLNSYDNCEIIVVNDYNPALNNEMFISNKEHFILLVNHKFKGSSSKLTCNCIKHINNYSNDIEAVDYYWHLAPYQYEMINTMYSEEENCFYLHKNNETISTNNDTIAFVLPGYTIYGHDMHYTNEIGFYAYFQFENQYSHLRPSANHAFDAVYKPIYMTDYYNMDLLYTPAELERENWEIEQKLVYKASPAIAESFYQYFLESQLYDGSKSNSVYYENDNDGIFDYDIISKNDNRLYMPFLMYNVNRYISYYDFDNLVLWAKSFINNNLDVYIINENDYQQININTNNVLDFISINGPTNNSKYCPGYIKPEFIDMFKFSLNHTLEQLIQTDLSLSNVELSEINNITAYPYRGTKKLLNKNINYGFITKNIIAPSKLNVNLLSKVSSRISERKTIITAVENMRLADSLEDLRISDRIVTPQYNQYNLHLKSFFGSNCMNIPDTGFTITDYTNNMMNNISIQPKLVKQTTVKAGTKIIQSSLSGATFKVMINLTKLLIGYFSSNSNFMSNWLVKNDIIINNFILNYILKFYNLKKTDITVYQRTVADGMTYSKNQSKTKCTLDPLPVGSIDIRYVPVDNLNIQINTDKSNDVIATFDMSAINSIAIYPLIKFTRQ